MLDETLIIACKNLRRAERYAIGDDDNSNYLANELNQIATVINLNRDVDFWDDKTLKDQVAKLQIIANLLQGKEK